MDMDTIQDRCKYVLFERLAENLPNIVFVYVPNEGYAYVNHKACESITGYSPSDFLNNPSFLQDVLIKEPAQKKAVALFLAEFIRDFEEYKNSSISCMLQSRSITAGITTKAGVEKTIKITAHAVNISKDNFIVEGVIEDVTKQVLVSRTLSLTESRYKEIVESTGVVHWEIDLIIDRFTFVSPQAEALLGHPLCDCGGMSFFGKFLHPEDRQNAKTFWVASLISGRQSIDFEFRIIPLLPNGNPSGEIKWAKCVAQVAFLGDKPVKASGILIDITEKKKLEEKLINTQKMEAIAHLSGEMAHDFGNILQSLIGFSDVIKRQSKEKKIKGYATDALAAARRGKRIVKGLLAFSRQQPLLPQQITVERFVRLLMPLVETVTPEAINVNVHVVDGTPVINVDENQMIQALLNLVRNSCDAMPDGGLLTIVAQTRKIDEMFISEHGYGIPGTYVSFNIKDTGCGMDEETKAKVNTPFFTTKSKGKGSGLGFTITYGTVKQAGGFLSLKSLIGEGTEIEVNIPVVEGAAPPIVSEDIHAEDSRPATANRKTILIVDDERIMLTAIRLALDSYGYYVVTASSGAEALERFNECGGMIDLVVIDLVMPDMNGKALFHKIKAMKPDVKVIFQSGHATHSLLDKGLLESEDGGMPAKLLVKPFDIFEFRDCIKEAIGE